MNEDFEKANLLIKSAKHVIVFTGICVDTIEWSNSLSEFQKNALNYYQAIKELYENLNNKEYSKIYEFINILDHTGKLLKHFEENIGGLSTIKEEKLVEVNGNLKTVSCLNCNKTFKTDKIKASITQKNVSPYCDCGSLLKIFCKSFSEIISLCKNEDLQNCDLLIAIGTNLMNEPFKSLIQELDPRCPRIYINNNEKVKFNRKNVDSYLIDDYNSIFSKLIIADGEYKQIVSEIFDSSDIHTVGKLIKNSSKIIIMSGAGISTSAGIPDFRSTGLGLYDRFKDSDLPHPTAIFSLDYFLRNPKPFYNIVFELYPKVKNAKPTTTHQFISKLNENRKLLKHYTQNVDGLDRLAGLPDDKLVEAHGHIKTGTCLYCKKQYEMSYIEKFIIKKEIPTCIKCNKVIKPDVVLFGESLPPKFKNSQDWKECDLLIIIGTSLAVQPFANLINNVNQNCPRVFINKTKFDNIRETNRDIFIIDECDSFCQKLAKLF